MVSISLDCNPFFSPPHSLPVQEHHSVQRLCGDVSEIHWSTEEVQTDDGELPAVLGREWPTGAMSKHAVWGWGL